ncbi:YlbD family protein [Sporolactobacillus sp. CPB3-1]|uniref:YlbD family protein n=1 Tax=Sporolactobacillus mangiferae TaxID=2940498 RepID=A0ABT0M7X1_9BACL|nr:YlbD family protein [Sporolactobacillus mangiferae]MCL1630965.1 YlbD family protein [Sporolactobacillus mangiferae]
MAVSKTNEAIKRFKNFLRSHPEIVDYVHKNGIKWNDVFDNWVIFGENHEIWKKYGVQSVETEEKNEKKKNVPFSLNKILKAVDTIDTKQWQNRLETISGALNGIQSFIGQFQQTNDSNTPDQTRTQEGTDRPPLNGERPQNPFFFRRD